MKKYIIIICILLASTRMFSLGQDDENFPQKPGDISNAIQHDTLVGITDLWFVGIKGGLGLVNINAIHEDREGKSFEPIFGYSGGIRGYFYLRKADIRVIIDFDYIKKGAREKGNKYDLHFIEFNFIASKRIKFLFLGIGLFYGYHFAATLTEGGQSFPSNKYRENDFGVVVSITAYFGSKPRYFFGLDIKYSLIDLVNDDINGSWVYMNAGAFFTVGIGIGS